MVCGGGCWDQGGVNCDHQPVCGWRCRLRPKCPTGRCSSGSTRHLGLVGRGPGSRRGLDVDVDVDVLVLVLVVVFGEVQVRVYDHITQVVEGSRN